MFFGPVNNPKNEKPTDLTPREVPTFAPLVVLALAIGLYPKPLFQILDQPVQQLVETCRPGLTKPVLATTPAERPAVPAATPVAEPAVKPAATTETKPAPVPVAVNAGIAR